MTPQQVVGYYPFEEPTGLAVVDASGLGHHAEIMNEFRGVRRVTGRTGGALEFTAGDPKVRSQAGCVALHGVDTAEFSNRLTVELWAQFTKFVREQTYELVSNSKGDRGPGFRFGFSYQSLWLRSGEGGSGKTWGAQTSSAAFVPKVGEWYHLAGTYDGSVFRVYVDGVLMGQSEPNLSLTPGQATVFLGSYSGGYAYGFDGVMDDVRLYNYPRSASQVALDAKLMP
ncbi:MAG: LamG domain-containing protein [Armatimonadota bacterium]